MKSEPSLRKTLGHHLLLELYGCSSSILNDTSQVKKILIDSASHLKTAVIDTSFHHFSPYGISGVVIIAESHLTIHTWPEYNYAAIDVFTCDTDMDILSIVDFLKHAFAADEIQSKLFKRGLVYPNVA